LSIGLVGGLLRCILCLRQSDLKAFVAYSSVCHMGFGLSGIYCYSFVGLNGGVYILMAHGFCSSCIFYLLYILYERFHTRRVFILKGMGILVPSFVLPWFIFSIINIGVPPSFSFFSEVFILVGLRSLIFYICVLSGVLLFLAGVYNIFFFVVSCHGSSVLDGVPRNIRIREYLVLYGHFFPLVFIPFFILFFLFSCKV